MQSKPYCIWLSDKKTTAAVSDHINKQFNYDFQLLTQDCFCKENFSDTKKLIAVIIDSNFLTYLAANIDLSDQLKREKITVIIADHDHPPNKLPARFRLFTAIRDINLSSIEIDEIALWIQGLFIEWKMSTYNQVSIGGSLNEQNEFIYNCHDDNDEISANTDYSQLICDMISDGDHLAFNLERIIETFPPLNLLAEYESVRSRFGYIYNSIHQTPLSFSWDELPLDKTMESFIIRLERAIELTVESFPPFLEVVDGWCAFGRVNALREKGFSIQINGSLTGDVKE